MQVLLDGFPTSGLAGLDYDMRWRESWTYGWDSLTVGEAEGLSANATDTVTVAAGLSMHRNGHVRQLAVVALDRASDPRTIRWLVLRCGDWVPEVRDAARRGVDAWLAPDYAAELVDVYPILDGARFGTGRPFSDLRQRISALLSDPVSQQAVERGAVSGSRPVRRACVRLLVEIGADVALLERVMPTNDVVAIAAVAAVLPAEGRGNRRTGEIMLTSPMARFRSEGLWRLTKDDEPGSEALVHSSLTDTAPSVREVAQRWMSDRGHDYAAVYRSMLDSDPLSALRGLGDDPRAEDAALARGFVDDSVTSVRVAALRLLVGVGDQADGSFFADRFVAGTAKERRHALTGLRRVGPARFVDEMWEAAQCSVDPRAVERVIYQVLPHAGRWKRIDVALQALSSDDPAVRDMGFEAMRRQWSNWNRGYPGPAPDPDLLRQRLHDAQRALLLDASRRPTNQEILEPLDRLLRSTPNQPSPTSMPRPDPG